MPLEISEIGVHVAVGAPSIDPAASGGGEATEPATPPPTQSRLQAIVAACVRKRLAALRLRQVR